MSGSARIDLQVVSQERSRILPSSSISRNDSLHTTQAGSKSSSPLATKTSANKHNSPSRSYTGPK